MTDDVLMTSASLSNYLKKEDALFPTAHPLGFSFLGAHPPDPCHSGESRNPEGDSTPSLSQNVDRVLMAGCKWLWEGHVSLLCDPQV